MNIGCFSVFLVGWMSHYCLFICLLMFCWAPLFIQSHLRFNHRRNSVVSPFPLRLLLMDRCGAAALWSEKFPQVLKVLARVMGSGS